MDAISEGDRVRARVGALLTPLSFGIVWLLPLPLDTAQHRLLAILCATVVAWITEVVPIPVTALMIAPAMTAAGITDAKRAFSPYADPLLFLFYGSFFIAAAMSRHGLDRRIAHAIVTHPLIAGVPSRTRAALMATGMMLSMWISNTASTAMLMPILIGTFGKLDAQPGRSRALTGSLLAIAYACSIGGVGTLVGTPPNLIAVGLLKKAGVELTFLEWSLLGVPVAVTLTAAIYALFARSYPPQPAAEQSADTGAAQAPLAGRTALAQGPLSRGEGVTAFAFAVAVIGWVLPGTLKAFESPLEPAVSAALPAGAVAMLASSFLFIFKDGSPERTAVLPWRQARDIDWGLIMLYGGGISLGSQMFETGLAETLGRGFIALTGVSDVWVLTALVIVFTIFFTEVCSNTATSNMVIPLVIGVTTELGVSPVPPTLGVALAASCAFMMPIATGPNAIVYSSGHIPLPAMVRAGFVLNLVCGALLFALLRLLLPAYGWG